MEVFASSMQTPVAPTPPIGVLRRPTSAGFALQSPFSEGRLAVERYIHDCFRSRHGADVGHFLPEIISLGAGHAFCAAVGIGSAANGSLFAETYLDAPVEQLIGAARGATVERRQVLEIGNLVSTWRGSGLALFVFLSEVIDQLEIPYVVFTATREVERLLGKLHYSPVVLADADPSRLPDGGASWGSYYQRQPRVMFGEVHPAVSAAREGLVYRALARVMAPQIERVITGFRQRHPTL